MSTPQLTRRQFMRAGSVVAGAAGITLAEHSQIAGAQGQPAQAKNCIILFLVGGPSQLETWDPKPDAPTEIRGPFRSIDTNVSGVRISEHLPRSASLAHR